MSRKARKAAQYDALLAALEAEGKRLYHNATLSWPDNDIPDGMEDVAWGAWNCYADLSTDDINHGRYDSGFIESYIASRYGNVYTWGRGGRTCAPEGWIRQNGGSSFNVKGPEYLMEDKTRAEGWQLLADMKEWNDYVTSFCSRANILEVIRDSLDEAMEEKMQAASELARMLTI